MGNALRSVSLRVRGYDEETEQLSEDLVGVTGKVADLTKAASTTGNITGIYDMSGGTREYVMAEWVSEDKDTSVYKIDLKYYDIYIYDTV